MKTSTRLPTSIASALGLLCLAACGGETDQNELSPGQSYLANLLSRATLEAYPETNLPPEIAARISGPLRMRSRVIRGNDWINGGFIREDYKSRLGGKTSVQTWRVQPSVAVADQGSPPSVLCRGEKLPPWDPEQQPFPGLVAWYDEEVRAVFALSESPPTHVSLEYAANPAKELGRYELRLFREPEAQPSDEAPLPAPTSLVRREELGEVSRPCILLPAPSTLSIPFERFPADELEVAVAVADRGYRRVGKVLERVSGLCGGADFAVEIVHDGRVEEVWTHRVPRERVGAAFEEARIDLRAYRDKRITLRLHTKPGPAGDATFAYGLWSALRLLTTPQHEPDRPNVIIIDVDTLRADRMSCYGNDRPTTPRVDAWAARKAILYRDAVAPASWTLPSTASMLTGLAPQQHGMEDHDRRLPSATRTLADLLGEAGYETYSYAEGGFFRSTFGLDKGFDLSDTRVPSLERRCDEVLERIRSRRSERPFFLFFQTYRVHAPYQFHPRFEDADHPYEGRFAGKTIGYPDVIIPYLSGDLELDDADRDYISRLYDAGIARMDDIVGRFIEELEVLAGDNTLIFFTSDHGEEFWEHGRMGHGHSLYQELLAVPLIVSFPGNDPSQRGQSDDPVTLLDIVPTVLDCARVPAPLHLPGQSLLQPVRRDRPRLAQNNERSRALQCGTEKLVLGRCDAPRWKAEPVQLYLLDEDPGERADVADGHRESVTRLQHLIELYMTGFARLASEESELSPEEVEALRALGYVRGN